MYGYNSTGGDVTGDKRDVKEMSAEERETVLESVIDGMANGQTLQDVASNLKIAASTIRKWLMSEDALFERYLKARKLQGQALAEEAIKVARETTNHSSAADRVLIDTLKWAASKANPSEYGEKQTVEHQGAQTLSIRVVEDEKPLRNEKAMQNAMAVAAVSAPAMLSISAPLD
jgi:hypothetical protein